MEAAGPHLVARLRPIAYKPLYLLKKERASKSMWHPQSRTALPRMPYTTQRRPPRLLKYKIGVFT